jgi:hypothetical protein
MRKTLMLLLISISCSISFSQVEDSRKRKEILKEYSLKRNNLEFFALGGFMRSENQSENFSPLGINSSQTGISFYDLHFGTAIRFSSNWYFTPENKNRWYFRTNWLMGGIVWVDGILFPSAPLNIGIGDNIQISRDVSLDLSILGGLVLIGPGILNDDIESVGVIYPEIKLQTKWISIGLIYSRYVEKHKYGNSIYQTVLIGLSTGI